VSRHPAILRVVVPGLVIAAALAWSYVEQDPDSGVEVRAVARGQPAGAHVWITRPQAGDTLAEGNIAGGKSVRYTLDPGAYVIHPRPQGRLRAKPIRVQVRDGRFEPVVVRYRALRRRGS
jgi:hypothetical protein